MSEQKYPLPVQRLSVRPGVPTPTRSPVPVPATRLPQLPLPRLTIPPIPARSLVLPTSVAPLPARLPTVRPAPLPVRPAPLPVRPAPLTVRPAPLTVRPVPLPAPLPVRPVSPVRSPSRSLNRVPSLDRETPRARSLSRGRSSDRVSSLGRVASLERARSPSRTRSPDRVASLGRVASLERARSPDRVPSLGRVSSLGRARSLSRDRVPLSPRTTIVRTMDINGQEGAPVVIHAPDATPAEIYSAAQTAAREVSGLEEVVGFDVEEKQPGLILISQEGKEFLVNRQAAKQADLLSTVLDTEPNVSEIPVPSVKADILKQVVDYLTLRQAWIDEKGSEPKKIDKPLRSKNMADVVENPAEAVFIDNAGLDKQTLYDLILAANYMGIDSLLQLGCAKVASLIKGEPLERIKDILDPTKPLPVRA